jgi:hypothetical protein
MLMHNLYDVFVTYNVYVGNWLLDLQVIIEENDRNFFVLLQ